MITEDYVSYETAKLLKEKGFDEPTTKSYYTEGLENPMIFSHDLMSRIKTDELLCPTLQMAIKWLREEHNIAIDTEWEHMWYAYIKPMTFEPFNEVNYQCASSKYEEACEVAIKYCLENLI